MALMLSNGDSQWAGLGGEQEVDRRPRFPIPLHPVIDRRTSAATGKEDRLMLYVRCSLTSSRLLGMNLIAVVVFCD
jgi:hypothetical protein